MYKYKINPCRACMNKFGNQCDVNGMNNCCYETAAAFANSSVVQPSPNCNKCIKFLSRQLGPFGKDNVGPRIDPPPIFSQVPHFFPRYLEQGYTPDQSRNMCYEACKRTPYPNSCMENCYVDWDAINK